MSICIHAQYNFTGISLTYGHKEKVEDDFIWEKTEKRIKIPIQITSDNVIIIHSEARQRYKAQSKGEPVYPNSIKWETIDTEGKRCIVYLSNIKNTMYLFVNYEKVGWFYELKE